MNGSVRGERTRSRRDVDCGAAHLEPRPWRAGCVEEQVSPFDCGPDTAVEPHGTSPEGLASSRYPDGGEIPRDDLLRGFQASSRTGWPRAAHALGEGRGTRVS